MKKKRIILFLMAVITVAVVTRIVAKSFRNTDTIANKVCVRIFELNEINVTVKDEAEINKVEIRQGNNVIYANGKHSGKMKQEYGHSILDIYYEGKILAEIGHYRTNNWFTNDYSILISGQEINLDVQYQVDGPCGSFDCFQKRYRETGIEYLTRGGEHYKTE